jgi:hypothetical protein
MSHIQAIKWRHSIYVFSGYHKTLKRNIQIARSNFIKLSEVRLAQVKISVSYSEAALL